MQDTTDAATPSGAGTGKADEEESDAAQAGQPDLESATVAHRRLWTPWRMSYVGGANRDPGCIFCLRLAAGNDAETLILHRANQAFVIMNLFPYNTGHVMLVPNEHIASPETANPEVLAEMAILRTPLLRALRRALSAEGFNLGMNVGAVAGAGIADHFHEHVVPRWQGDANFMPILASTMVLPELIPITYAKLRAEVARELRGVTRATAVVLARDGTGVLTSADGTLPVVTAESGEAVWRAVVLAAEGLGARRPQLLGWAGDPSLDADGTVLAIQADLDGSCLPEGYRVRRFDAFAGTPVAPAIQAARQRSDRSAQT